MSFNKNYKEVGDFKIVYLLLRIIGLLLLIGLIIFFLLRGQIMSGLGVNNDSENQAVSNIPDIQ